VQVSKEGQTAAVDSVGQERLPSTKVYLVIVTNSDQWTFRIRLRHQLSNASIFFGHRSPTMSQRHRMGRTCIIKAQLGFHSNTGPPEGFVP